MNVGRLRIDRLCICRLVVLGWDHSSCLCFFPVFSDAPDGQHDDDRDEAPTEEY